MAKHFFWPVTSTRPLALTTLVVLTPHRLSLLHDKVAGRSSNDPPLVAAGRGASYLILHDTGIPRVRPRRFDQRPEAYSSET